MKEVLLVRLESEAFPPGALEIAELTGREAISQLFSFEIVAAAVDPEALDAAELIGAEAALVFERDGEEERRVYGLIASVRDQLDTEAARSTYRIELCPRAHRLTLHETLDIFLDLSVPEIVAKRLELAGLRHGDDFEMRLSERYPPRDFVLQYKETDLQLISRLTEHLGISFFFEHDRGRDVMVFTDVNAGFRPIAGEPGVPFRARGDLRDVYALEELSRMVSSEYVVRDYNYRTPLADLTSVHRADGGYGGRVVEYGAHVKSREEGEVLARIRAEERFAAARVFSGESNTQRLAAGAAFALEGHPRGDIRLILTEVHHHAVQPVLGQDTAQEPHYQNRFKAIPRGVPYRPPRLTPKPRVQGVLTGVIDTEEEGQYAEVDEQGRYLVRFVFDTTNPGERQASRPLRMLQPHGGPGYGMHFPLRHGVEVAVTFIDGDPDRPIIAGTLPNPAMPSPVSRENRARNILRTGSGNELNIDDTEGSQRIKLSTPHASTIFQLGAPNSPESGAMLTTMGAQSSVAVAGFSSVGAFGAGVSALLDYNYSGNVINVAEKPSKARMALFGVVTSLDALVGVLQGAFDAALNQVTYLEKVKVQQSLEKSQAARRRQERCNACRARAEASLPDSLRPPSDEDAATRLIERLELAELQAKPAAERTYEEQQRLAELEAKYAGQPALTDTEKARARITRHKRAATDLDVKWLALIGVMEDRNGIILVNREYGNPNFEVQMQADVEAATGDYDAAVAAEQEAKDAVSNGSLGDPTQSPGKEYKAYVDALAACEDCNSIAATRKEAIDANNDTATQLYWSQGKKIDGSKPEWKADDEQWVKDKYPAWNDGLNPQSLRKGKIVLDSIKAGIAAGTALFSAGMALMGLFDGIRTAAELKLRWGGAKTAHTTSLPRSAAVTAAMNAAALAAGVPPLHVVGSEASTEVYGKRDVIVWGETAALLGMGTTDIPGGLLPTKAPSMAPDPTKGSVVVMGAATASLLSPSEVEIASGNKLYLTSTLMDVEARVKIDAKAPNVEVQATQDIKLTATQDIEATATRDFKATATRNVEVSGLQSAKLLSGTWELNVTAANGVTLGNPNASVNLSVTQAKIQSSGGSNHLTLSGSSALLSATNISLVSRSKITLM